MTVSPSSPKMVWPVCCYCDNVLSCAACGREQPADTPEAPGDVAEIVRALRTQCAGYDESEEVWIAKAADALERLSAVTAEVNQAMGEIANRAGNFMDADAADWMPSIYSIACKAIGEDPAPTLKACGFDGEPKTWPRSPLLDRALAAEARLAEALTNVEYWRLAAERRETRRERTGLDVAEAQTLEAPTPNDPVGIQQDSGADQ